MSPVAATMGFTPLDGLMMATRPGSLDPGILSHLQRRHGLTADDLDAALNHGSGLLGVSGVSSDFAEVERAAEQGNGRARLAMEMFADRVRAAVGALAVSMGGVDVLAFTDRVGENSPASSGHGLPRAGMPGTAARSAAECGQSARQRYLAADSPARILVIHTREELMIAREAHKTGRRTICLPVRVTLRECPPRCFAGPGTPRGGRSLQDLGRRECYLSLNHAHLGRTLSDLGSVLSVGLLIGTISGNAGTSTCMPKMCGSQNSFFYPLLLS